MELASLGQKVSRLEAEQEAVLSSAGEELDKACRSLARNAEDKLQVMSTPLNSIPVLGHFVSCWSFSFSFSFFLFRSVFFSLFLCLSFFISVYSKQATLLLLCVLFFFLFLFFFA